MKTNDEIKNAYFELMDTASRQYEVNGCMEDTTRERLVKGFAWMIENGYSEELSNYEDENGYEYFIQPIRNQYYNIAPKKESKLREMTGKYYYENDLEYDHLLERDVKISY